jgi:hypothetical protein
VIGIMRREVEDFEEVLELLENLCVIWISRYVKILKIILGKGD